MSTVQYERIEKPTVSNVLEIKFGRFAVATVSLPLFAFVFCVVWSLLFNFTQTTATHCNVPNFLPSMSAAIGSYGPQRYVWRLAIALHSSPRYLVAYIYYTKHKSKFVLTLNWLELSGLLGLTFVSSTENYRKLRPRPCVRCTRGGGRSCVTVLIWLCTHFDLCFDLCAAFHAKCFVTFMATALTYMFLVSYASQYNFSRKTRRTKRVLAWINFVSGCLAVYFFSRHNSFCEPGIYTLFALAEYVIVSSNIFFHFQAYHDLSNVSFCIPTRVDDTDLLPLSTHQA